MNREETNIAIKAFLEQLGPILDGQMPDDWGFMVVVWDAQIPDGKASVAGRVPDHLVLSALFRQLASEIESGAANGETRGDG